MRTRIKICGLTRPQDVEAATRLGADAVGFVFAPSSRRLQPPQARDLAALVPPWINRVGVFGPEEKQGAPAMAEACRLDTLQLNFEPDPAYCAYFRGRFSIIQVLSIGEQTAEELSERIDAISPHVDGLLLDTARPGQLGGTGVTFDWDILNRLTCSVPVMVAGGLKAENVGHLLDVFTPWGVDVSSGVELSPGIKDAEAMALFIRAVSNAKR